MTDRPTQPGRTYLVDGPVGVADGWWIVEDGHDPSRVVALASAHLTGNGALAYRGTCAGWEADATVGCVVHDTWDTAPGSEWTELCTVPDALWARWTLQDGTPLLLAHDRTQPERAAASRDLDVRTVEQHHRLMIERPDGVELRPRLPERWDGLSFRVNVRGCRLDVEVTHERLLVSADAANPGPIEVATGGTRHTLAPGRHHSTPA